MSFQSASAILRSTWLLDRKWASEHMPIVVSALKGNGSLAALAFDGGDKKEEDEKAKVAMAVSTKAGVVYKVGFYTEMSRLPQGSIAMISLTGPMLKYGDECSYGMVDKAILLQRVANAPNVAGVIIDMDSPGGQVSGTAMLADVIKGIQKPKIGVVDSGMAASAGYWVLSACDEIYVTQKIDHVGSIGVYTELYDFNAYLAKEGLPVHTIYAPGSEDKNADYREALKGNYDLIRADLKVLRDEFISTVQRNRAGKLKSDEWQGGAMFYAKDATRIGLIDGQKSFDQVVKRMDQMIATKSANANNNNMAFSKTLLAAKAESFEVVDGGFMLTEENLNNIEQDLTANASAITLLTTERDNQALQAQQATTDLATANGTIATHATRITELEGEVATLKAGPAGDMKNPVSDTDASSEKRADSRLDKYRTSFDDIAGY